MAITTAILKLAQFIQENASEEEVEYLFNALKERLTADGKPLPSLLDQKHSSNKLVWMFEYRGYSIDHKTMQTKVDDNKTYKIIDPKDANIILTNLQDKQTLNAVKHLKDITGAGLKECKEFIDKIRESKEVDKAFADPIGYFNWNTKLFPSQQLQTI